MAKKNRSDGIYRVIDVIGSSSDSWEDAAKRAVHGPDAVFTRSKPST